MMFEKHLTSTIYTYAGDNCEEALFAQNLCLQFLNYFYAKETLFITNSEIATNFCSWTNNKAKLKILNVSKRHLPYSEFKKEIVTILASRKRVCNT